MSTRRGLTGAERQASRWIARLEASDVTLRDHQRFRAWLAASEDNRRAYEALSRTWDKLDALKYLSATDLEAFAPSSTSAHKISRRWLIAGGAGAGLIAAGGAAFVILAPSAQAYETAVGGRDQAILEDGSAIELGADTRVQVRYSGGRREARIEQGEALFSVTADAARDFVVKTPAGQLVAQAAQFSVKLIPDGLRAVVLSGSVAPRSAAAGNAAAEIPANSELLLRGDHISVAHLGADRAAQRLAWRDGMLSFDGETLAEAVADVERQTGVHFEFIDPSLGGLRVGGYIDGRNAEAFITLLRENLDLNVNRAGADVVMLRRAG